MATSKIKNQNMVGNHYFETALVNASGSSTFTMVNNLRVLCVALNNVGVGYVGLLYTDNNGGAGHIDVFNQGNHITVSGDTNALTIANDTNRNAEVSFMYF